MFLRAVPVALVGVALGLLVGCHMGAAVLLAESAHARGPYQPEAMVRQVGSESVRTIGCLDIGLVPFQREGDDLVDFHFGNRCGHPEALDLRQAVIRGWSAAGEPIDIALADPRHEIDLVHLGGAEHAQERIRLTHTGVVQRMCFDLERIDPDAPAARPLPLCFSRTESGVAWHPG